MVTPRCEFYNVTWKHSDVKKDLDKKANLKVYPFSGRSVCLTVDLLYESQCLPGITPCNVRWVILSFRERFELASSTSKVGGKEFKCSL